MTREELEMRKIVRESDVIDKTNGSELAKAFNYLWDKYIEQEPKTGRTLDADELLKRISEKAKTPSLSEDTVNGLCGATAIIYDMLIESGKEE